MTHRTCFTLRTALTMFAVAAALTLGVSACSGKVENTQHVAGIQQVVSGSPAWVDQSPLGKRLWTIEMAFYESRQHMPAWIDGDGTTSQMKDLISQLHYAEVHGLDSARYGLSDFEAAREESQTKFEGTKFAAADVPELDAKMTYAYLRYAADLLAWGAAPKSVYANWLVRRPPTSE